MKKSEKEVVAGGKVSPTATPVAYSEVEKLIVSVRGQPVIVDADVAKLYGVATKRVNEAVRNNPEKFPADYMFELDRDESTALRSKISSLEHDHCGKRGLRRGGLEGKEHGRPCSRISKRSPARSWLISWFRLFANARIC